MAHAELFVMPSRVEPFGIVVLEAWRSGTPVLASRRGGTVEFVTDGINGLLVDPTDAEQFTDQLAKLLGDRSLRNQLSNGGLDAVRRFTTTRVADRYEQTYAEIRASARRHA